jgi:hypothetical protein
MQLREETQNIWADRISKPLWNMLKDPNLSDGQFYVAAFGALTTTLFNPSMIQYMALFSHGQRHRAAYASHYQIATWGKWAHKAGLNIRIAHEYTFHKHFLKKPLVPLTARIGARAVPILGAALLAHDFYTLATKGRFMGFKVR